MFKSRDKNNALCTFLTNQMFIKGMRLGYIRRYEFWWQNPINLRFLTMLKFGRISSRKFLQ